MEGTKIQTKAQFVKEGERSSRYFFFPEKCRRAKRSIRVLTKENLDTVTETRDLFLDTHALHTSLFTAQPYGTS